MGTESAAFIGLTDLHTGTLDLLDLAVSNDFDRRHQRLQLDAFFQSFNDLASLCGHITLTASVNNCHIFGAHTNSSARNIDCGVAATNDHHVFSDFGDIPAADLFQEVQAVVNTNLILADDTCGFAELGAGSNVDSVIITGQIIKIDILANLCIQMNLHTGLLNGRDIPSQNFLRQSIFRNTKQ